MFEVQIGYVDEPVDDKRINTDYAVNKIGGNPDWSRTDSVICKICGMKSALVLQIYAPLTNSIYHRTLYIFACINLECQNNPNSWICLRCQFLDDNNSNSTTSVPNELGNDFNWCDNAEDWGDNNKDYESSNLSKETLNSSLTSLHINNFSEKLVVDDSVDLTIDVATTDIEESDSTASMAELNQVNINLGIDGSSLQELLKSDLDIANIMLAKDIQFNPFYIYVTEEKKETKLLPNTIKQFDDYSRETTYSLLTNCETKDVSAYDEKYEKSLPSHGDKWFHSFISRINKNPGHIMRYCRDNSAPLFLYKEQMIPEQCKYCNGEIIFEIQILPTIIPNLILNGIKNKIGSVLEFGSVFIYTCKDSCWSTEDIYREEELIVQYERVV